jgi:hypothetical protein
MVVESRMELIELHHLGLRLGQRLDRKVRFYARNSCFCEMSLGIFGWAIGVQGLVSMRVVARLRYCGFLQSAGVDPTGGKLLWQGTPTRRRSSRVILGKIFWPWQEPKLLGMTT